MCSHKCCIPCHLYTHEVLLCICIDVPRFGIMVAKVHSITHFIINKIRGNMHLNMAARRRTKGSSESRPGPSRCNLVMLCVRMIRVLLSRSMGSSRGAHCHVQSSLYPHIEVLCSTQCGAPGARIDAVAVSRALATSSDAGLRPCTALGDSDDAVHDA